MAGRWGRTGNSTARSLNRVPVGDPGVGEPVVSMITVTSSTSLPSRAHNPSRSLGSVRNRCPANRAVPCSSATDADGGVGDARQAVSITVPK